MADDDPLPPLPTPTAQKAVKQAVATAHDAPDDTPVDGESPLPRPLFARPHPLSAGDNIFDDSDDDECLAEMQLPPSTSSRSRKRDDYEEDVDALESP